MSELEYEQAEAAYLTAITIDPKNVDSLLYLNKASRKDEVLFNHEDVTKVHYRGFEDIERQEFIYGLSEFYKEMNKHKESEEQ